MRDLENSVALVTGASRGIGRATALALAAQGCRVALVGRDEDALGRVADECEGAIPIVADLTDRAAPDRIVREATSALGPINVLVNNAGVGHAGSVLTAPWPEYQAMLDVNLTAVMRLTHRALPSIRKADWGALIFIASVSSKETYAGGSGYCATKFGVLGFAGAVFQDVRAHGIKVTSICPGWVDTDMIRDVGLPPDRMLRAEDVADAVVFAARMPASACVTEMVLEPQLPS